MRDYEWKSSLSGLMKSFIEMNHLAGLKFEHQERFLQHFDHFCFYNGYEGETLTREMVESFIYGQGGADRTLHNKEVLLFRFSEFMRQRGHHAYLPEIKTKYPASHHIPHIYTENERRRFLEAVDSYPHTPNSFRNTVDPILFRFLCGTGCRLSEALNLRIADFDYCLGAVTILHAKNGRNRIVPLCSSLVEKIHSYINSFHAGRGGDSYLFPGADRGKMDRSTAYTHFRDYILMADIPHPKDGPRIHDWRYPNQNKIQTFLLKNLFLKAFPIKKVWIFFSPFSLEDCRNLAGSHLLFSISSLFWVHYLLPVLTMLLFHLLL